MGDGKLTEAVADSGPLIHLSEINCLPLLNIFKKFHIPYAVWLETVERNRICRNDLSPVTNTQKVHPTRCHPLNPNKHTFLPPKVVV